MEFQETKLRMRPLTADAKSAKEMRRKPGFPYGRLGLFFAQNQESFGNTGSLCVDRFFCEKCLEPREVRKEALADAPPLAHRK